LVNPGLPLELAQEAIDAVEMQGSVTLAAKHLGLSRNTFRSRHERALMMGLRPTVRKDAPRVYERKRLGRMHLVIPDCQVKSGVPTEHLEWVGNYIAEKRPDVIVQIGDFADMPSLSSYDKGKLAAEGRRYVKDIAAVHAAMDRLLTPVKRIPDYKPEMHLTMGNHEYRIIREVEENPRYEGRFNYSDLSYDDFGWKVHDFLKVVELDGIEYAHYFTTGVMGRPVTSAAAMLRERQKSCIQGHVQYTDMAIHRKTQNIALFSGTCYLHDEDYLGPQGNNCRRQIVVCHEVENGRFDPMFVSLKFLEKNYA
jgi:hypothetical protein